MKKKTLLIPVFATFAYLVFSSYASGPAHNGLNNVTGSPTATGSCAQGGCHTGGSGTTGSIELRKKAWGSLSTPVTYYEAGETYIVTLKGTNSSSALTHFGFQFVVMRNSDNTMQGNYDNLGSDIHGFPQAVPKMVEHNKAIAKTGNEYVATFEWTAPVASSGALTMYAMINAVNKNGLATGDAPSSTILLNLNDKTSVTDITNSISVKAYPNPVDNSLNLDLEQAIAGDYAIRVISVSGAVVTNKIFTVNTNGNSTAINTSDWMPGIYFVQVQKGTERTVIPVVKM